MTKSARFALTTSMALTLVSCADAAPASPPEPTRASPPAPATPAAATAPPPPAPAAALIPGTQLPNDGSLRPDAPAYFPNEPTAARLTSGTLDQPGAVYFRGTVVSVDASTGTATVRDAQRHEYPVPVAYVFQASAPVTSVEPGQVLLGERFNRGELVMVTSGAPNERGEIPTLALEGFMPDAVRVGSDPLLELVPVEDGGPGSNAVCRGPNGVRKYQIIRRAAGQLLGFDGSFVRVLPETACRLAPLRPELTVGQTIVYTFATSHRADATVRAIDATTGAVTVSYPWGAEQREDTARFGSIVTELPPE